MPSPLLLCQEAFKKDIGLYKTLNKALSCLVFKKAKDALSPSNVMVHYDPSLPVILESDSSLYGIGEFIFYRFPNGDNRLIAHASSSLKSSEIF